MALELWASAFSLGGVVLGGGLTALTQRAGHRAADRAYERRQSAATAEARRAEQLQAIKEFIACAQDAERIAYNRPESWGDDDGWNKAAGEAMTRLWVAERHLVLLCDSILHTPVHDYGRSLNQAVWREIGDKEVNEHVEEHKTAFMTAARASLAARAQNLSP
ncbi:hypothetical protein [Kitasatospora sp. NPDC085879]|uniref:hypothetical protein n=1 Tax=Kitasatospora sp. NPDC085879 TaxID=3154769 RepID=UPI000BB0F250|nr:hypothetical protein [Streptomyces sp. TLI_235]PBC70375.1 hypothetical protein BX265_7792 [Streptomyces sp. TLI_235]